MPVVVVGARERAIDERAGGGPKIKSQTSIQVIWMKSSVASPEPKPTATSVSVSKGTPGPHQTRTNSPSPSSVEAPCPRRPRRVVDAAQLLHLDGAIRPGPATGGGRGRGGNRTKGRLRPLSPCVPCAVWPRSHRRPSAMGCSGQRCSSTRPGGGGISGAIWSVRTP